MLNKKTILEILNSEEFHKTLYEFIYDLYQSVYKTNFNNRFLVVYLVNDPNSVTVKFEIEQAAIIEKIKRRHFILFELDGLDLVLMHAYSNNIKDDLQLFTKRSVENIIKLVDEVVAS
jgi:predicted DNA-binding protein YlxM (UPF0122 family)